MDSTLTPPPMAATHPAVAVLEHYGYSHIDVLGSGAFGAVFACDHPDGRRVAAKVCFAAADRELLAREVAVMRALPIHPNILPIVCAMPGQACSVLIMPLATGGDTLALMRERQNGPMTEEHARLLFVQLLRALAVMHQSGFVHRDIKCENLLLADTARHQLIVADFGFSSAYRRGLRTLTESWGSAHYSSPEICSKMPYEGPEVDVWSAGVVLYAWVTGRLPFGGANDQEIGARVLKCLYPEPKHTSPQLNALFRAIFTPRACDRITIAGLQAHPWMSMASTPAPYYSFERPRSTSIVNIEFSTQEAGVVSTTHAVNSPRAPAAPSKRRVSEGSPSTPQPEEATAEKATKPAGPLNRMARFFSKLRSPTAAVPAVAVASEASATIPAAASGKPAAAALETEKKDAARTEGPTPIQQQHV